MQGTSSKGSVSKACLFILKALGWGTTITIINYVPKSQIPPLRPFSMMAAFKALFPLGAIHSRAGLFCALHSRLWSLSDTLTTIPLKHMAQLE